MKTATPPAMIALIAITTIISIIVKPSSRFIAGCLGESIGRIPRAVAMKNNGGVRRPCHTYCDQQGIGRGNGAQGLIGDGDARAVSVQSAQRGSGEVGDARHHAEAVVVAYVVERSGRASARFS